jgi:hypothetical protein
MDFGVVKFSELSRQLQRKINRLEFERLRRTIVDGFDAPGHEDWIALRVPYRGSPSGESVHLWRGRGPLGEVVGEGAGYVIGRWRAEAALKWVDERLDELGEE